LFCRTVRKLPIVEHHDGALTDLGIPAPSRFALMTTLRPPAGTRGKRKLNVATGALKETSPGLPTASNGPPIGKSVGTDIRASR
jgi:hypothetical protein